MGNKTLTQYHSFKILNFYFISQPGYHINLLCPAGKPCQPSQEEIISPKIKESYVRRILRALSPLWKHLYLAIHAVTVPVSLAFI